jgi:hypothetical protein
VAGECVLATDGGVDAAKDTGSESGADTGTANGKSDPKVDGSDSGSVEPQNAANKGNWGLATGGGGCACETRGLGSQYLGNGGLLAFVVGLAFAARRKNKKRDDQA